MPKTGAEEQTIVSAQLALADRRRLEELAREGTRSLSAEIRRAVNEHLERAEKEGEQ